MQIKQHHRHVPLLALAVALLMLAEHGSQSKAALMFLSEPSEVIVSADTELSPTRAGTRVRVAAPDTRATLYTEQLQTVAMGDVALVQSVLTDPSVLAAQTVRLSDRERRMLVSANRIATLIGQGKNGQMLTVQNGKPVWRDAVLLQGSVSARATGLGRKPLSVRTVTSDGDTERRYGGGGGSNPTEGSTTGQSGAIDINGATYGVLSQFRGGTGFAEYSTGDLLVGASNQLSRLGIGSDGQVLTVSGGSVRWTSGGNGITQSFADSRYVNTTGDTMTGALMINLTTGTIGLEVVQTISGSAIFANTALRSSGSLAVEGGVTFASLTSCTALETDGFGNLVCGTDDTGGGGSGGVNTGSVLSIGDSRYVNTSGDTMTGALTINLSSGTVGLEVIQTISGSTVFANTALRSSGTLVVRSVALFQSGAEIVGTISGSALRIATNGFFDGAVYGAFAASSGDAFFVGNDTKLVDINIANTLGLYGQQDNTVAAVRLGSNGPILSGNGGNLGIGTGTPQAALEVVGTVSGSNVYTVGSVSGSHLYAATTFGGAGLADCDTAGTSKLLWDATTKRFTCGTDVSGSGGASTGSLMAAFDNRYVNTSGDTMTGALVLIPTGGSGSLALRIVGRQTLTGSVVFAASTAATKPLIVKGAAGQTANLTEWHNSAGTKLGHIAADGQVYFGGTTGGSDETAFGLFLGTNKTNMMRIRYTVGNGDFIVRTSATPGAGSIEINSSDAASSGLVFATRNGMAFAITAAGRSLLGLGGALPTDDNVTTLQVNKSAKVTAVATTDIPLTLKGASAQSANLQEWQNSAGTALSWITASGAMVIRPAASAPLALNVIGTASGQNLFATKSITGSHLYAASTFGGAGLADCDTAGTSKLLWDATNKVFSCGTDQSGGATFSTGSLMGAFDTRYVNTSGDTMTGALTINLTSGTVGLEVIQTISGSTLFANTRLVSSGTLVTESGAYINGTSFVVQKSGNVGIGTANPTALLQVQGAGGGTVQIGPWTGSTNYGAIYLNGDFATAASYNFLSAASGVDSSLYINRPTARDIIFRENNGGNSQVIIKTGGNIGIGTNSPKARLAVTGSGAFTGTLSGSALNIQGGTSYVRGSLGIGTVSPTAKLHLVDSSFSIRAGQATGLQVVTTGTQAWTNVGTPDSTDILAFYNSSNTKVGYVTAGGAMTSLATGNNAFVLNSVGANFGFLSNVNSTTWALGYGTTVGTLGTSVLSWNDSGNVGIGTTSPGNALEVLGTASGSNLFATKSITGSHLYAASTFGGAGLADCDTAGTSKLLWDATTKQFSCGTDQTGGSSSFSTGSLMGAFDTRYVNTSGDTMTGALIIRVTGASQSAVGLEVINTISGASIHASSRLTLSGASVMENQAPATVALTLRGAASQTANLLEWQNSSAVLMAAITSGGNLLMKGPDGYNSPNETANVYFGDTNHGFRGIHTNGVQIFTFGVPSGITLRESAGQVGIDATFAETTSAQAKLFVNANGLGTHSAAHKVLVVRGKAVQTGDLQQWQNSAGTALAWITASGAMVINPGVNTPIALEVMGNMSGATVHAEKSLTSSGLLIVESRNKFGSGALSVIQGAEFGSGAYVSASGAALLALDAQGRDSRTPHIMFGYQGVFDVSMYRENVGELRIASVTGTTLTLDTEMTSRSGTVFQIFSDFAANEDRVLRVQADGKVFSDSSYNSSGADYAEYFFSGDSSLQQGEVVCIDVTRKNAVKRCDRDADGNVMGIVSTNPAFIGNVLSGADGLPVPGYVLVGLIGQVPAKVTAEGGEIRPGDALTAASIPGLARKAAAGESTVGVALEGLEAGEGTVNVLISRRNQSLTVEAVEENVLKTIANMEIGDEIQLSIASALDELNLSKEVTSLVSAEIDAMDLDSRIERIVQDLLAAQPGTSVDLSGIEARLATLEAATGSLIAETSPLTAAEFLTLEKTLSVGGDTRIGGDLYLEGALLADSLFVPGAVTVDGTLSANRVEMGTGSTANGLFTVNGDLLLNGSLRMGSGSWMQLSDLIIENTLYVMGDLTIEGLASFLGDVEIQGELRVNGRQAGHATVMTGATSVSVTFQSGFTAVPVVTAASEDFVLSPWRIKPVTVTGFTIELMQSTAMSVTFAWHALVPAEEGGYTEGTVTKPDLLTFPIDSLGYPLSDSEVWNACIRNRVTLDENGQPYSCSRYHIDSTWTHPDLGMEFIFNAGLTPPYLKLPDGYEAVVTQMVENMPEPEAASSASSEAVSEAASSAISEALSSEPEQATSSVASQESIETTSSSEATEPLPEPMPEVPSEDGTDVASPQVEPVINP